MRDYLITKEEYKMNIYGQEVWHDDVVILGTKESLKSLRKAIDLALKQGKGNSKHRASDGLVYTVKVRTKDKDDIVWEEVELPYRVEMEHNNFKKLTKYDLD